MDPASQMKKDPEPNIASMFSPMLGIRDSFVQIRIRI